MESCGRCTTAPTPWQALPSSRVKADTGQSAPCRRSVASGLMSTTLNDHTMLTTLRSIPLAVNIQYLYQIMQGKPRPRLAAGRRKGTGISTIPSSWMLLPPTPYTCRACSTMRLAIPGPCPYRQASPGVLIAVCAPPPFQLAAWCVICGLKVRRCRGRMRNERLENLFYRSGTEPYCTADCVFLYFLKTFGESLRRRVGQQLSPAEYV